MEKLLEAVGLPTGANARPLLSPIARREIIRKSLHMLIALVPAIATQFGTAFALTLLAGGTLVYSYSEVLRVSGFNVLIISRVTLIASRPRDRGRFVLGPVTLATGAMLALLLYPAPAATIAIYALAFGDSFAALVGSTVGTIRPRFLAGKSLEGSAACFVAVFAATTAITANALVSVVVAVVATIVEALPTDDLDNMLLPTVVGLVATVAFPV